MPVMAAMAVMSTARPSHANQLIQPTAYTGASPFRRKLDGAKDPLGHHRDLNHHHQREHGRPHRENNHDRVKELEWVYWLNVITSGRAPSVLGSKPEIG